MPQKNYNANWYSAEEWKKMLDQSFYDWSQEGKPHIEFWQGNIDRFLMELPFLLSKRKLSEDMLVDIETLEYMLQRRNEIRERLRKENL